MTTRTTRSPSTARSTPRPRTCSRSCPTRSATPASTGQGSSARTTGPTASPGSVRLPDEHDRGRTWVATTNREPRDGYDENALLAWKTAPAGTEPPGWEWMWELKATSSSSTDVTLTYDWSKVTDRDTSRRCRSRWCPRSSSRPHWATWRRPSPPDPGRSGGMATWPSPLCVTATVRGAPASAPAGHAVDRELAGVQEGDLGSCGLSIV